MSSFESKLREIHPKTRAGWRSWLKKNHAKCDGVWLIYYRASIFVAALTRHHQIEMYAVLHRLRLRHLEQTQERPLAIRIPQVGNPRLGLDGVIAEGGHPNLRAHLPIQRPRPCRQHHLRFRGGALPHRLPQSPRPGRTRRPGSCTSSTCARGTSTCIGRKTTQSSARNRVTRIVVFSDCSQCGG